jgi:hypothetical protein
MLVLLAVTLPACADEAMADEQPYKEDDAAAVWPATASFIPQQLLRSCRTLSASRISFLSVFRR